MNKAIMLAAALVLVPLPALCQGTQGAKQSESSPYAKEDAKRTEMGDVLERLSQSQIKDRLASAIERVEDACADDIEEFCGSVTPGGGRIALCMRANADQLSRRCRLTLFRVSRDIRQNVTNIADECWTGIKAQCSGAEKFGECAEQKAASISPACHTVVAALRQAGQKIASLRGMPVFSADDKDVGRIVEVQRGPDGKIQSVQIQVGRFLGIGDKVVTVGADKLQELADRIKLRLGADEVRSLPEAKRQGNY
ncbi:MAG: PRC-barrel domain-containing protein [Rhodomicrobium sp.]|nr:PRC-barrel domain-containing protein [Rhodomicrobium sp.]